jgi:hypothetical protein
VILVEVPAEVSATPDVQIHFSDTTPIGGVSSGVLGVTLIGGQVILVNGWNWYTGSNPTQIGADQYDFQTVLSHELGHTLGLGHSTDTASVMYPELAPGSARRTLTTNDLAVIDQDNGGSPEPLMAAPAGAGSGKTASATVPAVALPVLTRTPAPNSAVSSLLATSTATSAGHPDTGKIMAPALVLSQTTGLALPTQTGNVDRGVSSLANSFPDDLPAVVITSTTGPTGGGQSSGDWLVTISPYPYGGYVTNTGQQPATDNEFASGDAGTGSNTFSDSDDATSGQPDGGTLTELQPIVDASNPVKVGTLAAMLGVASMWWISSPRWSRTIRRRSNVVLDKDGNAIDSNKTLINGDNESSDFKPGGNF